MQTFKRICAEDFVIKAHNGDKVEFKRGTEYITSPEKDGVITVFTSFWVVVPVALFCSEREFTK